MKSQFLTAPNQITLLRLIFIPFVIIKVLDGNWPWALGLLIAAGLSDALDGLLARALHQQTMLGQYLDPIADKLLLSSLFLVLSVVEKDSLEIHRAGVQPRRVHRRYLRGSVCYRRFSRLPSQHLWQDQYPLPDLAQSFSWSCAGHAGAVGTCGWRDSFSTRHLPLP